MILLLFSQKSLVFTVLCVCDSNEKVITDGKVHRYFHPIAGHALLPYCQIGYRWRRIEASPVSKTSHCSSAVLDMLYRDRSAESRGDFCWMCMAKRSWRKGR